MQKFFCWLLLAMCSFNSTQVWAQAPTAAPTLNAPTLANQSAGLSWNAVSNATSYRVYRSTSSGILGSLVHSPSGTSQNATGLTNGSTYYFTIRAANSNGEGPSSNQRAATPMATPALYVSAGHQTTWLSWTSVTGATSYSLYRGTTSSSLSLLVGNLSSSTLSYTNNNLTPGTTYYYYLVANNSTGTTTSSTVNATVMSVPQVTVTPSNSQIKLEWPVSPGATAYEVRRGSAYATATVLDANNTSRVYTDTTVTAGNSYTYYVVAKNSSGYTYATLNLLASDPPVLYGAAGNNQAILSWSAISGATRYDVYRGTNPNDISSFTPLVTNLSGSTSTYPDTGLANGTTYHYGVVAFKGTGHVFSNIFSVTPTTPPTLSAGSSNAQVTLNWTSFPGALSYSVYRGSNPNDFSTFAPLVSNLSNSTLIYTDNTVVNGTTYHYAVMVFTSSGTVFSNSVTGTPTVPPVLSATPGDGQVTLNWTTVNGATGYGVFRGTDPNNFNTFAPLDTTLSSSTLTYPDTGLNNGTAYHYVIVAAIGTSYVYSNFVSVTPSSSQTPSAVTSLTAIAGDKAIALSWKANSMATGYKLRRTTTMGDFTGSPTVLVSDAYYHDPNVLNGTTYYYSVSASNSYGDSTAAYASAQPFAEAGNATPNRPTVLWRVGNPISCAGIRWPFVGATISPSAEGKLSAFLATDFDQRDTTVASVLTTDVYSDPCTYTWSASGGSFKDGVNTGQGAIWIAPSTPGTYTITLVVDDQNKANQPTYEAGNRSGDTDDEPLTFTRTVTVAP